MLPASRRGAASRVRRDCCECAGLAYIGSCSSPSPAPRWERSRRARRPARPPPRLAPQGSSIRPACERRRCSCPCATRCTWPGAGRSSASRCWARTAFWSARRRQRDSRQAFSAGRTAAVPFASSTVWRSGRARPKAVCSPGACVSARRLGSTPMATGVPRHGRPTSRSSARAACAARGLLRPARRCRSCASARGRWSGFTCPTATGPCAGRSAPALGTGRCAAQGGRIAYRPARDHRGLDELVLRGRPASSAAGRRRRRSASRYSCTSALGRRPR